MKLYTVIVTYNRLKLTKRTVESYLETVTLPYELRIVDNASTDGTQDWILHSGHSYGFSLLQQNHYPGHATNTGFTFAPSDATHLHRSDNDVEYKPGWCDEVVERFSDQTLWQLGLRTVEEEGPHAAVGGNCVFAREAWEHGIRYSMDPWSKAPFEDALLARQITKAGYRWERVTRPCIEHIGLAKRDDPYYQETFAVRGITFEQYGL